MIRHATLICLTDRGCYHLYSVSPLLLVWQNDEQVCWVPPPAFQQEKRMHTHAALNILQGAIWVWAGCLDLSTLFRVYFIFDMNAMNVLVLRNAKKQQQNPPRKQPNHQKHPKTTRIVTWQSKRQYLQDTIRWHGWCRAALGTCVSSTTMRWIAKPVNEVVYRPQRYMLAQQANDSFNKQI